MTTETVKRVTKVSTDISRACEHCDFSVEGNRLPDAINHYISDHGYRLLHVGEETVEGMDGPASATVAILGSDDPPPVKATRIPTWIIER